MLRNQWGRQMAHYELYPLLGFNRGAHLPKEGFLERMVTDSHGNSVCMMCLPANEPKPRANKSVWDSRAPKSSKHRLFYLCEDCHCWVPFGRAGQHRKGREHKLNHEIAVGRP